MAYDFPNSPTLNQIYPASGPGQQWQWDGTKWVAYNVASGGATVVISDSAPASPIAGTLWFDSLGTQMYIFESDGNSTQWVPVVNQGGALTLATATNVGRNLLHNGLFNVAQRGNGGWTAAGYTADRWMTQLTNDTIAWSRVAVADANRAQIGDETASWMIQNVFTGAATAGSFNSIEQRIEGVRRLAGKTVTLSFWAIANTGTPQIGVNFYQVFGTGGSPSATVQVLTTGLVVTAGTTFARYSVTATIPSASGKTFGTNGDDFTIARLFFSASASTAAAGNIPTQSNTIWLWGIQLELGNAATPLEKPDPQQDLAKCQRFYQLGRCNTWSYSAAGQLIGQTLELPVPMRAAPTTVAFSGTTYTNASGIGSQAFWLYALSVFATVTATGAAAFSTDYTLSADL